MIVHHRLRLLAFPTRASAASMLALADDETSRFPEQERSHMPVSKTTPGRPLALSRPSVLPSVTGTTSAPRMRVLFRGRDGHYWPPPAQIRACAANALGSYLEWLTAKRGCGHG